MEKVKNNCEEERKAERKRKQREMQRQVEAKEEFRWRQNKEEKRFFKKVIEKLTNYQLIEKGMRATSHSSRKVMPIRPLCCYMKKINIRTQGEK